MTYVHITVMGSFIADLMARADHLPVPGETVLGTDFKIGPGGKGSNQAVAASRAGAGVTIITKIGDDYFGKIALKTFTDEGMDRAFVYTDNSAPTGVALIMVDEHTSENKIIVNIGANGKLSLDEIEQAREVIITSKVLLTQLETGLDVVDSVIAIARAHGVTTILNPAPARVLPDHLLAEVDILTPNEIEAATLANMKVVDIEDAGKAARVLLGKGVKNVIVTLGGKGCLVVNRDGERYIEPFLVEMVDTTGAGDAFNGALATALAEGKDLISAARFANATGALSVTRIGTAASMPYRQEIEALLNKP